MTARKTRAKSISPSQRCLLAKHSTFPSYIPPFSARCFSLQVFAPQRLFHHQPCLGYKVLASRRQCNISKSLHQHLSNLFFNISSYFLSFLSDCNFYLKHFIGYFRQVLKFLQLDPMPAIDNYLLKANLLAFILASSTASILPTFLQVFLVITHSINLS